MQSSLARFIAMYSRPVDDDAAEAFETAYRTTHLPLVGLTPGLKHVEVSRVLAQPVGPVAFFLMAEMVFVDADALRLAMASPEWARAGRNLAEIGGLDLATMLVLDDPEQVDVPPAPAPSEPSPDEPTRRS